MKMFNVSKSLPVREFCAKFCDGTNLFFDGTSSRAPDHSSTLILPRGGSDPPPGRILPLAVPHLCDPQYSITPSCQNTDYYKDVFCIFSPLYASRTQQFKLPNVKQHSSISKMQSLPIFDFRFRITTATTIIMDTNRTAIPAPIEEQKIVMFSINLSTM